MAGNDDAVMAVAAIQCPTCGQTLDTQRARFAKYSKRQRARMRDMQSTVYTPRNYEDEQRWEEDRPSELPERSLMVVTCENVACEQYNKFKVLRVPRIDVVTARVEL